jgi:hypothetical protein
MEIAGKVGLTLAMLMPAFMRAFWLINERHNRERAIWHTRWMLANLALGLGMSLTLLNRSGLLPWIGAGLSLLYVLCSILLHHWERRTGILNR